MYLRPHPVAEQLRIWHAVADPDGATEGAKFLDDPSPAGESFSAYAGSIFRTLLSV
jgi:hypothetical protein